MRETRITGKHIAITVTPVLEKTSQFQSRYSYGVIAAMHGCMHDHDIITVANKYYNAAKGSLQVLQDTIQKGYFT